MFSSGDDDDDELIVRASAVLKSQGPENWSRGRPGEYGDEMMMMMMVVAILNTNLLIMVNSTHKPAQEPVNGANSQKKVNCEKLTSTPRLEKAAQ